MFTKKGGYICLSSKEMCIHTSFDEVSDIYKEMYV